MEVKKTTNTVIAVVCGIAFGALALWGAQLAIQRIQEHDANPRRASVKNQLMRRKAAAMDEALNATIGGNLRRVNAAAGRMKQAASKIDGFLATEVYANYGEDFHRSIEELLVATSENNREGTKEAILRLEKSCIECHYLINRPE
jgi:hypothetical protein